jgi:translation initiation factor IF-2
MTEQEITRDTAASRGGGRRPKPPGRRKGKRGGPATPGGKRGAGTRKPSVAASGSIPATPRAGASGGAPSTEPGRPRPASVGSSAGPRRLIASSKETSAGGKRLLVADAAAAAGRVSAAGAPSAGSKRTLAASNGPAASARPPSPSGNGRRPTPASTRPGAYGRQATASDDERGDRASPGLTPDRVGARGRENGGEAFLGNEFPQNPRKVPGSPRPSAGVGLGKSGGSARVAGGKRRAEDSIQDPQRVPTPPRSFAPNPGPPRPSAGVGWS